MQFRILFGVVAVAATLILGLWFLDGEPSSDSSHSASTEPCPCGHDHAAPHAHVPEPGPPVKTVPVSDHGDEAIVFDPDSHFSPEMKQLIRGIHAGRVVRVQVGDSEKRYVFRPKRITADGFKISAGASTEYPSSFQIFAGREVLEDGSLSQMAKLAIVNDTLSMAYTTEMGDHLIEENENGELVSRTLLSLEEGSTWGHFQCEEINGRAGIRDLSGDSPEPPVESARVRLASEAVEEQPPGIAGAQAAHPYFRLGAEYDASLKDITVLMVSSKSRTGTNLSSSAATYFTYAATAADVYEYQLGLRYLLQELVLIPQGSTEDDIEPNPYNVGDNNGNDDIAALKAWCDQHRPQGTYQWGHAAGWTFVDGDRSNKVGWAEVDGYGSSTRAYAVNEPEWTWKVHVHELGHNVGASHTTGGAMDPTVYKSRDQNDFFTEYEYGGYTAATDIYNYMSNPGRNFVFGPADLRNPIEMPFAEDDTVSTAADTPVTFNPLTNDLTATPLFGIENNLSLVEVGQVFPKAAGTATVSGNEITFTPSGGFTGNVWFSYTVRGNVGNDGKGWLHSADVIVTVGGSSSDPNLSPATSLTTDVVRSDLSGPVRLNPLLNDEGNGQLWAGDVDAFNFDDGSVVTSDESFYLVGAQVITGNGTVQLESVDKTVAGSNTQGNTGYLVYTPGGSEPSQVEIEYTVEDASGTQTAGTIYIDRVESVAVSSSVDQLGETEGRIGAITFTRSGSTVASEWVDFTVGGEVSLTGSDSDVALSGYDSFDAISGQGRITIPAGQASVSLKVSVMEDTEEEGAETLNVVISSVESLVAQQNADLVALQVVDGGSIASIIASEDFEGFVPNTTTGWDTGTGNGWTNEATSPGIWTADSGGTPSSGTGPASDHTLGTSAGVFLYREASGSHSNEQADLTSPVVDLSGTGNAVLEFFYHMYGSNMGELRVDIYSGGSWNLDVMTPLVGQQQASAEEDWQSARIDVSAYSTSDFQVRFRGITGPSYTSDMAIDDFIVGEPLVLSPEGPNIQGQPQSQTVFLGDPVYLSVVAQAFPSPTYQWKKDGVDIPGATRSVLPIESAGYSDEADYVCEVTSGTTVTSSSATVSVELEDDSDADQLSDSWEQQYFGNLDQGPNDDPDGDGDDNLTEFTNGTNPTLPPGEFRLARGIATDVGSTWQTVSLPETYSSMVVVANVVLADAADPVMVPRIRNASGNSFEIRVQNPAGAALSAATVHYMAMEEGAFTVADDGFKIEAVKFTSTVTDSDSSWVGESRSYQNSYSNPVVIGQVMTENDADWSTFWCYDGSNIGNPPSASGFAVGKHVGGDSNTTRADETIAYIVLEAGSGTFDGADYVAGLGADSVQGPGDSPPYPYTINLTGAEVALVTLAAMDGTDGGHACLYGTTPVTDTSLNLVVDEDTLSDTERAHTSEQVAYLVFAANPNPDSDGDGIDDSWETTYFGSSGSIDGSADSDGDGVPDFFEYLYGSIPTDATSSGFRVSAGPDGAGSDTVFDWKVKEGFVIGQDYEVWISTNLTTWDPLPDTHYTLNETVADGKTTVELTLTHDYGEKAFLRLEQP